MCQASRNFLSVQGKIITDIITDFVVNKGSRIKNKLNRRKLCGKFRSGNLCITGNGKQEAELSCVNNINTKCAILWAHRCHLQYQIFKENSRTNMNISRKGERPFISICQPLKYCWQFLAIISDCSIETKSR